MCDCPFHESGEDSLIIRLLQTIETRTPKRLFCECVQHYIDRSASGSDPHAYFMAFKLLDTPVGRQVLLNHTSFANAVRKKLRDLYQQTNKYSQHALPIWSRLFPNEPFVQREEEAECAGEAVDQGTVEQREVEGEVEQGTVEQREVEGAVEQRVVEGAVEQRNVEQDADALRAVGTESEGRCHIQ